MSERAERAKELFKQGYNCSQAVVLAFCDETGLDPETAVKISSGFGGGIGRMREVCGAVSGMCMVASLLYSSADPTDRQGKAEHYKRVQELAKEFKAQNSSIICRELLGETEQGEGHVPSARTSAYYKKRPCAEIVECAAAILDEYIQNNKTAGEA